MSGVWIGLGSNLGNSLELVREALKQLDLVPGIRVLRASSAYRSRPLDVASEQPEFINGVAELEVHMQPLQLLNLLLQLEKAMGRTRTGQGCQPRLIDLDLLLFNDCMIDRPELTVPHPRLHKRAFVLLPLCQLSPTLVIPGRGMAEQCLAALDNQEVEQILGEKLWEVRVGSARS